MQLCRRNSWRPRSNTRRRIGRQMLGRGRRIGRQMLGRVETKWMVPHQKHWMLRWRMPRRKRSKRKPRRKKWKLKSGKERFHQRRAKRRRKQPTRKLLEVRCRRHELCVRKQGRH